MARPRARRRFGSIRALPSGQLQVRYPAPDGQYHPAPTTFGTQRQAELWLSRMEVDIAEGRWVDHRESRETVAAWAERFMATNGHIRHGTRQTYRQELRARILPEFGEWEVGAVKPIHVRKWVTDMQNEGLSPSWISGCKKLLTAIFELAVESNAIRTNPARKVRVQGGRRRAPRTIITRAQAASLVAAVPHPVDRLLMAILVATGCRIGEAFALRRSSVDLKNGRLVISESLSCAGGKQVFGPPKNGRTRYVKLPETLVEELREALGKRVALRRNDLLFTGHRDGGPWWYQHFTRAVFAPATKAVGLEGLHLHDLRASHASWLISSGFSVVDAAERIGDDPRVVMEHYARAMAGKERQIAEWLDTEPPAEVAEVVVLREHRQRRRRKAGDAAEASG